VPSRSFLHLWDDRFLYVTPAIQSGLTARSSFTLLISVSGRPFTLVPADGRPRRYRAALVAPHVARRLDTDGHGLISLNLDPASADSRALASVAGGMAIQAIDVRRFGRSRELFDGALHGQLDPCGLHALSAGLVGTLAPRPRTVLDRRVAAVLSQLRAAAGRVPLAELAASARLSPDRLRHLFHDQTGLSLTRYLLWAKIRRAVAHLHGGCDLTAVAHTGGFADSAHMSRTFQRYFGLAPSFLANARQVEVSAAQAGHQDAWLAAAPQVA